MSNRCFSKWWVFCLWLLVGMAAQAAVDIREFDSETDRMRYQSFIDEMRCPKCQNQNLAGSDAPIAKDLRDQIYRLIEEGRSDKEIVDFMVERYGEYVLYRPPLSTATLILYAAPPVILVLGIITLIVVVRQRRAAGQAQRENGQQDLSAEERAQLSELLNDSDDETPSR